MSRGQLFQSVHEDPVLLHQIQPEPDLLPARAGPPLFLLSFSVHHQADNRLFRKESDRNRAAHRQDLQRPRARAPDPYYLIRVFGVDNGVRSFLYSAVLYRA